MTISELELEYAFRDIGIDGTVSKPSIVKLENVT
jgi:hypothetical protein